MFQREIVVVGHLRPDRVVRRRESERREAARAPDRVLRRVRLEAVVLLVGA